MAEFSKEVADSIRTLTIMTGTATPLILEALLAQTELNFSLTSALVAVLKEDAEAQVHAVEEVVSKMKEFRSLVTTMISAVNDAQKEMPEGSVDV